MTKTLGLVALAFACVLSPVRAGTWTHVGGTGKIVIGNSMTLSLSPQTSSGNLLVVGCYLYPLNGGGDSVLITDNSSGPSDSWTSITNTPTADRYLQVSATIVTGGTPPTQVSITSNAQVVGCAADYYSGGPPTLLFDGGVRTATGTSSSPTVSFTTGATGDLLWSFAVLDQGSLTAPTVASPFTLRQNPLYNGYSADPTADVGTGSVVFPGTYTATFSLGASSSWGIAILGFKAPATIFPPSAHGPLIF